MAARKRKSRRGWLLRAVKAAEDLAQHEHTHGRLSDAPSHRAVVTVARALGVALSLRDEGGIASLAKAAEGYLREHPGVYNSKGEIDRERDREWIVKHDLMILLGGYDDGPGDGGTLAWSLKPLRAVSFAGGAPAVSRADFARELRALVVSRLKRNARTEWDARFASDLTKDLFMVMLRAPLGALEGRGAPVRDRARVLARTPRVRKAIERQILTMMPGRALSGDAEALIRSALRSLGFSRTYVKNFFGADERAEVRASARRARAAH